MEGCFCCYHYLCLHHTFQITAPLSHDHLSETHAFAFIQSTVAAQTPPLWAVRRRGDLQHLEGTPGEAPDQQVTHRWAEGSHKAPQPVIFFKNVFADLAQ